MEKRTLRIVYPQWQGGANPDYAFGAELLSQIAPPSARDETVTVRVSRNFQAELTQDDGIAGADMLLAQTAQIERGLREAMPERVIVFGGDCSVSQAPFDYLKSRYGAHLGILWLDAHPDVATLGDSAHLHEMVLGNLLGFGSGHALTRVAHTFSPEDVLLAGLPAEDLREIDRGVKQWGLTIASPEQLQTDSRIALDWTAARGITHLAVHWDLDVLAPADYRSILPAKPHFDARDFPAAVGRMTLGTVGRLLRDVSEAAEIVGLSIAEHMPWDALNLRRTLADIPIFQ
ncbi:MAG: arginase family protein [Christensenellales bacterium]|jgi:arginase